MLSLFIFLCGLIKIKSCFCKFRTSVGFRLCDVTIAVVAILHFDISVKRTGSVFLDFKRCSISKVSFFGSLNTDGKKRTEGSFSFLILFSGKQYI